MNNYNINLKSKFACLLAVLLLLPSCSEDFLERPPEDTYSIDTFYNTPEQVKASTNMLYVRPWYNFVTNVAWCIGELSSGNGRTWDPRNADFVNFAITGEHGTLTQAWESLYAVIAQANTLINTMPDIAASNGVSEDVINNALGEARFIRGVAYFYLVRIFGPIPIISNNYDNLLDPIIPRNFEEDVYEFIRRDFQFAVDNLTNTKASEPGRISSNGAKAMLAKLHLYLHDYQTSYQLATEVIQSGEFKLLGGDAEDGDTSSSYSDLFLTANDNNAESIFALQWTTTGVYAEGNGIQSLFAPAGVTGFADGWSAIGPSIDLQEAYEDPDSDVRFHATIMTPEYFYPDLNGGYTVSANIDHQGVLAGIKKYVIGMPQFNGGGAMQSYPNNTYILRYGELLLIHAEAALNGGGSTGEGINSFNKVRRRAGLTDMANPTLEDVFNERRIELAYEFEFWYDVTRRGSEFALDFLANTERGTYDNSVSPPTINSEMFTPNMDDMTFPYPSNEIQNNPALLEPPVSYDFN